MIIIDGYNLLHASGVFGEERGPRGFELSRRALLDHLLELLGPEAERTLVVFDAAHAPDGLPARLMHGPMRVWFAREYPDADSLIEEVLEDEPAGNRVVVSSDRRVQAAARRCRATPIGSDEWLKERRVALRARRQPQEAKPPEPGPGDVEAWKRYFGV
jgi:predicted RNA-binding protein with PIN domain